MDLRLQLLETFHVRGSDGSHYKVCAYDRLARDPTAHGDRWESTGSVEYRLDDGRTLQWGRDGTARVDGSGVVLALPARAVAA